MSSISQKRLWQPIPVTWFSPCFSLVIQYTAGHGTHGWCENQCCTLATAKFSQHVFNPSVTAFEMTFWPNKRIYVTSYSILFGPIRRLNCLCITGFVHMQHLTQPVFPRFPKDRMSFQVFCWYVSSNTCTSGPQKGLNLRQWHPQPVAQCVSVVNHCWRCEAWPPWLHPMQKLNAPVTQGLTLDIKWPVKP